MKKTIFWMVVTLLLTFLWMGYWFETELGDAKFIIGWSAFFGYFAFWANCKSGKRVIDYICDEILK